MEVRIYSVFYVVLTLRKTRIITTTSVHSRVKCQKGELIHEDKLTYALTYAATVSFGACPYLRCHFLADPVRDTM